jgi:hypothetical protein
LAALRGPRGIPLPANSQQLSIGSAIDTRHYLPKYLLRRIFLADDGLFKIAIVAELTITADR